MKGQTSKGLRITILVYTIYSMLYGLLHMVSPEIGSTDYWSRCPKGAR